MMSISVIPLVVPEFFDRSKADQVFPVPYQQREKDAIAFRKKNNIAHWKSDKKRICMLMIDNQISFCIPPPWGHLFVGGRSGKGAINDSIRTCEFIYRNASIITRIIPTLDSHKINQIFHGVFWVDRNGETIDATCSPFVELDDVISGKLRPNPALADELAGGDYDWLKQYALHYVQTLKNNGQYKLELWPYHAILGGVGHAMTPIVEEAVFFHGILRNSPTDAEIKGGHPMTENYSVFKPEVLTSHEGKTIARQNERLMNTLFSYDAVIACGQAASHCFAWTMEHLRQEIVARNSSLARKIYILEDCTSPVVIPGVADFTDVAQAAFKRFSESGMNIVKSTDHIANWPNINHVISE